MQNRFGDFNQFRKAIAWNSKLVVELREHPALAYLKIGTRATRQGCSLRLS